MQAYLLQWQIISATQNSKNHLTSMSDIPYDSKHHQRNSPLPCFKPVPHDAIYLPGTGTGTS